MRDRQVSILKGSTFIVSDRLGDVRPRVGDPTGLFYQDMRHLSRWQLQLNGRELDALAAESLEYDEAVFYLVEPTGSVYRNPSMSLIRRREVGDGMREHLELINHGRHEVHVEITILFDADFADLFEVKDELAKRGELYRIRVPHGVTLGYLREDAHPTDTGPFRRETYIRAPDAYFTEQSLTFRVRLAAAAPWREPV